LARYLLFAIPPRSTVRRVASHAGEISAALISVSAQVKVGINSRTAHDNSVKGKFCCSKR
jgi:hypothetical protein